MFAQTLQQPDELVSILNGITLEAVGLVLHCNEEALAGLLWVRSKLS